jgi:hypothetical protein
VETYTKIDSGPSPEVPHDAGRQGEPEGKAGEALRRVHTGGEIPRAELACLHTLKPHHRSCVSEECRGQNERLC